MKDCNNLKLFQYRVEFLSGSCFSRFVFQDFKAALKKKIENFRNLHIVLKFDCRNALEQEREISKADAFITYTVKKIKR